MSIDVRLTFGTGEEFVNPTPEQIRLGLEELTGFGDSFAILGEDEMTDIQTSGGQASGFLMEYQAGSLDQHSWSVRDDLPLATVQSLFLAYAAGDESCRSAVEWAPEDLSGLGSSTRAAAIGYILAGVVFLLAAWWLAGWGLH